MSQARVLANYVSSGVTAAEFDFLDITTSGFSEASKVLTANSVGSVTISDGTHDFHIASHDGTNGLRLGGVMVTATAALINTATQPGDVMALAIALG